MIYYLEKNIIKFQANTEIAKHYLSHSAIKKILAYRNKEHIADSFVAFLILKYAIMSSTGEKTKIDPQYSEYGKPYLPGKEFFFSVSHSDTIIACGLSKDEIGIDVQEITAYTDDYSSVLSTKETDYLNGSQDIDYSFTVLWTLKEAYGKMIGKGLLYDIQNISFVRDGRLLDEIDGHIISTTRLGNVIISSCSREREEMIKIDPNSVLEYVIGRD